MSNDEAQPLLHEKEDRSPISKYIWFYSIFFILNMNEFIIFQLVFGENSQKYPVGSFLVYLTNLHGLFQTFYYIVCLIEGIFYNRSEWVKLNIPKARNWMFGSIAFPVANFVGCKSLIFKKTVFSVFVVSFFALVHNFGHSAFEMFRHSYAHGGILISIWGDAIISKHLYADSIEKDISKQRRALFKQSIIPIILAFAYLAWNFIAYHFNGRFPYAFQDQLKDKIGLSILIYFIEGVLMWILFWMGYYVNRRLHRNPPQEIIANNLN
jgi:hypothetical protein